LSATLHVHLHFLHHLRGQTIDYVGLAVAACASWIIGIGPGEPLVVAAGVFAAKHKLDLAPVIFWAWIGAMVGGVIGWLLGMKAGRAVLTAPGPLRQFRLDSVSRGERLFKRREVAAILLTWPWVAGVNRSRPLLYLPLNAVSALFLWAAPLAIGAYFIGPPVLDFFSDIGLLLTVGLVLAVVAVVAVEVVRRRRRAAGRPAGRSLSE
jgi:membrane protein DedA with SNARE-associated domain